MGQEFHVVRCFSCQTFQVQQVKKVRKWSCKMCGEKQSLMKEYGRGTGADCRRHVQKLNSLRGELLEVENESAWAQWDKEEECEVEDSFGDEAQSSESQQGEVQAGSRWSKYVGQKDDGPTGGDDEEEENIYTERQRFRSRDKLGKRKKGFTLKGACGSNTGYEDKDPDIKRRPVEMPQRGGFFKSSSTEGGSSKVSPSTSTCSNTSTSPPVCDSPAKSMSSKGISTNTTGGNEESSVEFTGKHQLSESIRSSSAPCQRSSKAKLEAEGSKWARFLTSVSVEEENAEEDDNYTQKIGESAANGSHSSFAPVSRVSLKNTSCSDSEEHDCARAPLDHMDCHGTKNTRTVFEKLSHCMSGITSKSPTFSLKPVGSQSPVCLQPPPIKRPCTSLSFSTFFQTDEDFDDTI